MGSYLSSEQPVDQDEEVNNQVSRMSLESNSFQPKKLKNPIVTILNEILKEKVKLNDEEVKENNAILHDFLFSFIEEMKKDKKFAALFKRIYYTGSFYSDLRVSKPDEFDLNLVLKLPFKSASECKKEKNISSEFKYKNQKRKRQLRKRIQKDKFLKNENSSKKVQTLKPENSNQRRLYKCKNNQNLCNNNYNLADKIELKTEFSKNQRNNYQWKDSNCVTKEFKKTIENYCNLNCQNIHGCYIKIHNHKSWKPFNQKQYWKILKYLKKNKLENLPFSSFENKISGSFQHHQNQYNPRSQFWKLLKYFKKNKLKFQKVLFLNFKCDLFNQFWEFLKYLKKEQDKASEISINLQKSDTAFHSNNYDGKNSLFQNEKYSSYYGFICKRQQSSLFLESEKNFSSFYCNGNMKLHTQRNKLKCKRKKKNKMEKKLQENEQKQNAKLSTQNCKTKGFLPLNDCISTVIQQFTRKEYEKRLQNERKFIAHMIDLTAEIVYSIQYNSQVPSYAKYCVTDEKAISAEDGFQKLFENGYLIPNKVRVWIQSVIDKALRTYKLPRNVTQINCSASGPARTIILVKRGGGQIDIDLVPAIECSLGIKPPGIDGRVYSKVHDTLQCFLVPKPYQPTRQAPVNDLERLRLWRTHYPDAETKVLLNLQCVKPVIKLLKLLRDKENWKILASYYLKTILLWMVLENPSSEYWRMDKIGERFLEALRTLAACVNERKIRYFFSSRYNLLEKLSEPQANNIHRRLLYIIRCIENDSTKLWEIFDCKKTFTM